MSQINIKTTKEVIPQCYAYTTPGVPYNEGWTKIGFTERDVYKRVSEQTQTAGIKPYINWHKNAIYEGTNEFFTDKDFHAYLSKLNVKRRPNHEWFKIDPDLAKNYFNDFRENKGILKSNKTAIFYKLRKEQEEAVLMTEKYFKTHKNGEFLWNAKPRFGKTLSCYDLCMNMGFINILVVTNRPAIANSWYEDYVKFVGADSGYYFVSHVDSLKGKKFVIDNSEYLNLVHDEKTRGCIEFVSLQDLKGSIYFGGDIEKLGELSKNAQKNGKKLGRLWDILIIDEAHEGVDTYKTDIAFDNIGRKNTLHLSGTPFKALANEKFPQDAIYNWTYADEQKSKRDWDVTCEEENPYLNLPRLNLFTYQMSEIVKDRIEDGLEIDGKWENYAFDLNEFFATNERGKFTHEVDVDKFLDALTFKEKFPFSSEELRNELKHTFWLLDRVDSAKELARKLSLHPIFKEYKIILAAGDGKLSDEDSNENSYNKVIDAIKKYEKTITVSVGQLTTGITVPQWSAVLILNNIKSPSLYMQAAFRCQNPCLFTNGISAFRKENSYIFDFDPARTLKIFEEFANDLSIETNYGKAKDEDRKKNIRELLNFFPVYGEDEEGKMIELDAEKILITPRKIYAKEVVNHGFMSNFLFANISNIFSAPEAVKNIVDKMSQVKKQEKLNIDDNTPDDLNLDENKQVNISEDLIIGEAQEIFGQKIYEDIKNQVSDIYEERTISEEKNKTELDNIRKEFVEPIKKTLIEVAKTGFDNEIKKSTQKNIERKIDNSAEEIIKKVHGKWEIDNNILEVEKEKEINNAKSGLEVSQIEEKFDKKKEELEEELFKNIKEKLSDDSFVKDSTKNIVEQIETEKKVQQKKSIEDNVRDHLRGFARTIPSFLMAYGDDRTCLDNFDKIIPSDVFKEVTSISLDEFRFLRDGGEYTNDKGLKDFFNGNLFDHIVFDDACKEFLLKKKELANYFDEKNKKDIFDYIPPQKTNQIFTPKKVVIGMVDYLEEENPGCFDDPDKTFIDLYMKSGLYITEIVKRLFRSKKMKILYPNEKDRLNHIFSKQIYGLAPSEIIYRITLNFILGFSDKIEIKKHNIKKLDSLEYAKKGILEDKLDEIF